jgi:hypothetical protein
MPWLLVAFARPYVQLILNATGTASGPLQSLLEQCSAAACRPRPAFGGAAPPCFGNYVAHPMLSNLLSQLVGHNGTAPQRSAQLVPESAACNTTLSWRFTHVVTTPEARWWQTLDSRGPSRESLSERGGSPEGVPLHHHVTLTDCTVCTGTIVLYASFLVHHMHTMRPLHS